MAERSWTKLPSRADEGESAERTQGRQEGGCVRESGPGAEMIDKRADAAAGTQRYSRTRKRAGRLAHQRPTLQQRESGEYFGKYSILATTS